jgi:hypothetical protein
MGSIDARAQDVFVEFTLPRSQPARAGHVAVTFLVDKEGLQEFKDPFFVLAEVVTLPYNDCRC